MSQQPHLRPLSYPDPYATPDPNSPSMVSYPPASPNTDESAGYSTHLLGFQPMASPSYNRLPTFDHHHHLHPHFRHASSIAGRQDSSKKLMTIITIYAAIAVAIPVAISAIGLHLHQAPINIYLWSSIHWFWECGNQIASVVVGCMGFVSSYCFYSFNEALYDLEISYALNNQGLTAPDLLRAIMMRTGGLFTRFSASWLMTFWIYAANLVVPAYIMCIPTNFDPTTRILVITGNAFSLGFSIQILVWAALILCRYLMGIHIWTVKDFPKVRLDNGLVLLSMIEDEPSRALFSCLVSGNDEAIRKFINSKSTQMIRLRSYVVRGTRESGPDPENGSQTYIKLSALAGQEAMDYRASDKFTRVPMPTMSSWKDSTLEVGSPVTFDVKVGEKATTEQVY